MKTNIPHLELRPRGEVTRRDLWESRVALAAATDRFADRIRRIRVRLSDTPHGATFGVRAWVGAGDTIVVHTEADTIAEAARKAADTLNRALRRRWSTRRDRRRRHAADVAALAMEVH